MEEHIRHINSNNKKSLIYKYIFSLLKDFIKGASMKSVFQSRFD